MILAKRAGFHLTERVRIFSFTAAILIALPSFSGTALSFDPGEPGKIKITHTHSDEEHHHHEKSEAAVPHCDASPCHPHTHEIVILSTPAMILTEHLTIQHLSYAPREFPAPRSERAPTDPGAGSIFRPPIG